MSFERRAMDQADRDLDAFAVPRISLASLSFQELVGRRIALAIAAHRFQALHTLDSKSGTFHSKPDRQRAYDNGLRYYDDVIAERIKADFRP